MSRRPEIVLLHRCAALAACSMLAAPASALPVAGLGWVSLCTAHGIRLHPIGKEGDGGGKMPSAACHSTCTLPRKSRLR